MRRLIIFDAHALLHRFFHALPPLSTKNGEPAQALFGLSRMLMNTLENNRPDFIAAAFDRPEPTFRAEVYSDYKGHRPKTDGALISQLQRSREVFSWFNIPVFEKPGFEADDIIGTLATRVGNESDLTTAIISGDLDLLQLVRDQRTIVELIKNGITNTVTYNEAAVVDRYGLTPDQLPDYKALVGDPSDNIPGVKGIGPKKARELLEEFKTIEGIFENIALVTSPTAEMLVKNQKTIELWRTLSRIKKDVPLPETPLPMFAVKQPDTATLSAHFRELGFTSLVNTLASRP